MTARIVIRHAPDNTRSPEDWRAGALCLQFSADTWFPEPGGDPRPAKLICNGNGTTRKPCPVKAECLAWALENDERLGVYGGMSGKERARLHDAHIRSRNLPHVCQCGASFSTGNKLQGHRISANHPKDAA